MTVNSPENLLNKLLQETGESAWLEFKVNNADPDYIGKWISACSNAAILAGKQRAFLVFGIEDQTHKKVGTTIKLQSLKKGGESFIDWISRIVSPRVMMEFHDFQSDGMDFSIISIEPTYEKPVEFLGESYIRVGESIRKLKEYPNYERAIWFATGQRKFENAIALPHQTAQQVFEKLDVEAFFRLSNIEHPSSDIEILRRLASGEFIVDDSEGGYDITNLGAILFAKDITTFPSIRNKSIRVIKYTGKNKSDSSDEIEGRKGYAVGFAGLLKYVMSLLPSEERYMDGIRRKVSVYPEIAVREIIANSLIHQDFLVSGASPVIEIYSDRIEVINPGNSLIDVDRIIDERRSRNEKLASAMRSLGMCEERGGGLDKALLSIEALSLPAFSFEPSKDSMRVVLFAPKKFNLLTKEEKHRACFFHCIIRYIERDYMSNTSLRERFLLANDDYQVVSTIISEMRDKGKIIPAELGQANRNARYIPYWVRKD